MSSMTNARLLIVALCMTIFIMADAATAFRFAAWADTKSGTATLKTESELVNGLNPAFTIYPGDLCDCTSGNNPTCFSNDFSTWKTAFNGGGTNNLFDKSFITRGNHDANTNTVWQQKFEFAAVASTVGATYYSALAEDMTYSFDYDNSHFVGIDVTGGAVTGISSAQITWLDADLAAAESRGKTHAFLFWHGPIYPVAHHCCGDKPSAALQTVIKNHPIISATFHGHEHVVAYKHITSAIIPGLTMPFEEFISGDAGAGPNTMTSGRADGWLRSDGAWANSGSLNTAHGFILVDVNGNDYTVSIYNLDGSVAKTFSFSKAASNVVSIPTFSPAAGTYPSAQTVTITTATSGATIHYTTDGTTPTETSPAYTTPVTVSSTKTIKAGAWKTGMTPSVIAAAVYDIGTCTINSVSVAPQCSGGSSPSGCEIGEQVRIDVSYSGTCPSTSYVQADSKSSDNLCRIQASGGSMVGIQTTCTTETCTGYWTIPAVPVSCQGKTVSAFSSGIYSGNYPNNGGVNIASKDGSFGSFAFASAQSDITPPVRSNGQPAGTITTYAATLSLSTNEAATCRYSTTANIAYDSMTSPTTSSGTSHSWSLSGLTDGAKTYYVRCIDTAGNKNTDDYSISFTVSALNPSTVSTPAFSPAEGTYSSVQIITITTATYGATIHYTTDGTTPTETSPVYTTPIQVSLTTTIKAGAWKTGMTPSMISNATYTVNLLSVAAPAFTPSDGTYTSPRTVTITTSTSGATIHYTADGTTPTEASPAYSIPLTVSSTTTIKAGAWKTGMAPSAISNATYYILTPVLTSITTSPSADSIPPGLARPFTASAKDQLGNPMSVTFTWSSSNTTVGTISSSGLFTALMPGTAKITAANGSVKGNSTVIVSACSDKLDIVFVLDTSFSMIEPCSGVDKITCLKNATKLIADSSQIEEDRMSIFRFSSDVEQIIGLNMIKDNRENIKNHVDLLVPGGWTALGDGLKEGLEYLNHNKYPDSKGIVILLTDGMVNVGNLNTTDLVENYVKNNWKDGPYEVYSIGLGDKVNKNMLEKIAEYTHGKFYAVNNDCSGQCMANLFLDSILNAKGGFKVSYLFTTCDKPLTKTIVFDSCVAKIGSGESNPIKNITIVDSFDDNLRYVANSGNVTYLVGDSKQSMRVEPALTTGEGKKILTFDINNIGDKETRIIVDFNLNGSESAFDSVSGTKNNASVNFTFIDNNYELHGNATFLLSCGCPANPGCDGSIIGNNPDCAQDELSCDVSKSGRKFGYRDKFGNCTAKPGCYCVEDPWQWTADPQYSKAACECIAGYNMWETSTSRCCSIDQCFVSDDATWVCDKGTRKDGFFLCEKISACGRELYWNETYWSENIPDGCDCASSERCGSGICLAGKCLTPENPNISFTYESVALELGSKTQIVIYVKNNLAVRDTINVKVYTSPEKLMNWIKFENGENEIGVNLEGHKDKRIVLDTFAGQTGSYKVTLVANSMLSPSLHATDEQYVQVMYREKGIYTNTPDIQWISVFIVILIAMVVASDIFQKKNQYDERDRTY